MNSNENCYRPDGSHFVAVSQNGRRTWISASLAAATILLSGGTSATAAASINPIRVQQSSPIPQYVAREEDIADALHEVKDSAGLTWEQVALLFGVSRKSVHNWLSSGKISKANRAVAFELLERVRAMAGDRSFKIRKALMGYHLPTRTFATGDGPLLESVGDAPRHRVASEENALEILE